jgi:hypothetical protein
MAFMHLEARSLHERARKNQMGFNFSHSVRHGDVMCVMSIAQAERLCWVMRRDRNTKGRYSPYANTTNGYDLDSIW